MTELRETAFGLQEENTLCSVWYDDFSLKSGSNLKV
jgi:hypothetical protein